MTEPNALPTTGRIAVIDLGSNSLRLVIFERLGGALFPLLNERVMCGLGRGITSTGRLNPEGVALALVNLRRFVALARNLSRTVEAPVNISTRLTGPPDTIDRHTSSPCTPGRSRSSTTTS